MCDNLFTEEEVEQAADEGFDCASCQPYVVKPVGEYWGQTRASSRAMVLYFKRNHDEGSYWMEERSISFSSELEGRALDPFKGVLHS